MVLTSSKFADIMPRSWDCQKPSMEGFLGIHDVEFDIVLLVL